MMGFAITEDVTTARQIKLIKDILKFVKLKSDLGESIREIIEETDAVRLERNRLLHGLWNQVEGEDRAGSISAVVHSPPKDIFNARVFENDNYGEIEEFLERIQALQDHIDDYDARLTAAERIW